MVGVLNEQMVKAMILNAQMVQGMVLSAQMVKAMVGTPKGWICPQEGQVSQSGW